MPQKSHRITAEPQRIPPPPDQRQRPWTRNFNHHIRTKIPANVVISMKEKGL
jgi:hypothetical protein